MKKTYKVGGMMCAGCAANVERALKKLPGVEDVLVDLNAGTVTVSGDVTKNVISEAIEDTGFDFLGIEG